MTTDEFNILVNQTISLVERLIYEKFKDQRMTTVKNNLLKITENGFLLLKDSAQLKTCYYLRNLKIESFRLTFFERIFFADGKGTYGKVNSKNTEEQIKKRYLLNLNQNLPVLIIKTPAANKA